VIKRAPKSRKTRLRHAWFVTARALRGVMLLEDTPTRIARGSAIGIFFTFQVFVGSQMALAALVTKLCRGNVLASLPWTWITNPFTGVPIYYAAYQVGCIFLPGERRLSQQDFAEFLDLPWREQLSKAWELLWQLVLPIEIGATVIGAICATIGYLAMRRTVIAIQRRRNVRRHHWVGTLTPSGRLPMAPASGAADTPPTEKQP
jgi:uncharacterized protein (DUF2062 family)